MLTSTQKQELDKIKFQYDIYVALYEMNYQTRDYKKIQEIEKECLQIFYRVIIHWAKENNVEAFCTAWNFKLPEKYYKYKFSVERIALWNNKNSVVKKSSWMNKVSLDRIYNRDEKIEFRIYKHKVTTDVNMLEPFASNFCEFMNDVVGYLNQDNDFSKYQ